MKKVVSEEGSSSLFGDEGLSWLIVCVISLPPSFVSLRLFSERAEGRFGRPHRLSQRPDQLFFVPARMGFCGLPFDPACLDFHKTARTVQSLPSAAQVRQPIRRDTARSALYGDKLDRLRRRLREAGALAE